MLPHTSSTGSVNVSKTAMIAGGLAAAAITGIAAYCTYKTFLPTVRGVEFYVQLAEKKKQEGIERFREKDYEGALKIFTEAITVVKNISMTPLNPLQINSVNNVIANCNNNLSACCEQLKDIEGAINYCSDAIAIDSKYVKSLRRRARLHEKCGKFVDAIHDLFTLTPLCSTQQEIINLNLDIDRVLQLAILPEVEQLLKESENVYKKIPQYVIAIWLWNTTINDPIVKRCEKLNTKREKSNDEVESQSYDKLDDALALINAGKYNEVLPVLLELFKNEDIDALTNNTIELTENGTQEKSDEKEQLENGADKFSQDSAEFWNKFYDFACTLLLTARFYHFHNQTTVAREYAKRVDSLLTRIDEKVMSEPNWVDLRVAYFSLMVTIAENDVDAESAIEAAAAIAPNNTDPLITYAMRHLDKGRQDAALKCFQLIVEKDSNHPYAKFYMHYLNYVIALKDQAVDRVRAHIYEFDQSLRSTQPPVFAQLLFVKVCMNSENMELAICTLKNVLKVMPDNAYALYMLSVMDNSPMLTPQDSEKICAYVNLVEKCMFKVLAIDPNYWEPYRTLAKIAIDKAKFETAMEYYNKAIPLSRTREDVELLLKDKMMTRLMSERAQDGRSMPFVLPDAYAQPAE